MYNPPDFNIPLPGFDGFPTPPFVPTVPVIGIPGLASGVVVAQIKGWNKVLYQDVLTGVFVVFEELPSLVALAEARPGEFPLVEAPTIKVPGVPTIEIPYRDIPQLPLYCYRCTYPVGFWVLASECGWMKIAIDPESVPAWFANAVPSQLRPPTTCPNNHGSAYIEKTSDFGLAVQGLSIFWTRELIDWKVGPFDLNFIRDALLKGLYWAYYGVGKAIGSVAEQFMVETLMVQSIMNNAFLDITSSVESSIQGVLDKFRGFIEGGLNEGLSTVIPRLYEMMGLAPGMLMNPVETRNVNKDGFEFYSLSKGMKLHYLAAGPRA